MTRSEAVRQMRSAVRDLQRAVNDVHLNGGLALDELRNARIRLEVAERVWSEER